MQSEMFDSPNVSEWDEEEPYYDWDDPDWREDWDEVDGGEASVVGLHGRVDFEGTRIYNVFRLDKPENSCSAFPGDAWRGFTGGRGVW